MRRIALDRRERCHLSTKAAASMALVPARGVGTTVATYLTTIIGRLHAPPPEDDTLG